MKNLEGDNKRNAGKVFVKCSVNTKTQKAEKEVRLGVLGASGYTGSEVSAQLVYFFFIWGYTAVKFSSKNLCLVKMTCISF